MLAGGHLLKLLKGQFPIPLLIGLYFVGLALTLILIATLCMFIKGRKMPEGTDFGKAFALVLPVFFLAVVFQFIYSLEFYAETQALKEYSSYIFLIDESGSMFVNDMNNDRATAIRELMKKQDSDFPYAVYGFDTSVRMISDMMPASNADSSDLVLLSGGGTEIVGAIKYVLNDIKANKLIAGPNPHIILVTDGEDWSTERQLKTMVGMANELNVKVSTIGVGVNDAQLLKDIAIKTGGKSVTLATMDQLGSGMERVVDVEAVSDYSRTLLNKREGLLAKDWIYSLIRILALVILSLPFILIKSLLLRTNDVSTNVLAPNLILVLIGALGVEIGMNMFFLPEWLMLAVLCIGFTILFVTELRGVAPGKVNGKTNSFDDEFSGDGADDEDIDFDYDFD